MKSIIFRQHSQKEHPNWQYKFVIRNRVVTPDILHYFVPFSLTINME